VTTGATTGSVTTGGTTGGVTTGGTTGSVTTGSDGGSAGSTAGTISVEDDGANCAVATLPDPATLTSIAKLPDPFQKLDGTRMSTKAEWRCRREEIRKMAEKYALGTKPAPPQSVTGSVTNTSITVQVSDNGKAGSFSATVSLPPSGTAPYPVIIAYSGINGIDPNVIKSEGVATVIYNPTSVGAEGNGHGPNQTGAFYSIYSGGSVTGLLVAWAWGVSRIIDVIQNSDGTILRADAVGVTGCSLYGKGAFIAGAFDQRIALTMPVESGTMGEPIWRGIAQAEIGANGNPPESLLAAYNEQPWYADAFNTFTNNPAKAPLDTHELLAMIAPRGVFIMDNPYLGELAANYGHVAALGGEEVYTALGAGDAVSYNSNVASGTHCSTRTEWTVPLQKNIERFLKKSGNAAGTISPYPSQTGDLSVWRDWTTPTLN
jgi:hypothetical protein